MDRKASTPDNDFFLKCHHCGERLPFLHPHIMVERQDEGENLICEACFESQMKREREERIQK